MRPKYRILLALVLALVAMVALPFLVGDGVRLWIWWKARTEKFSVKIDKIDAPFLRPVTLRGVQIRSAPEAAFRVELNAAQVVAALNFKSVLLHRRGRFLQNISASDLRLEIHRNAAGTPFPEQSWLTWQKLLPNSGDLQRMDLRVEDGATVVLVRGASLSFDEIEAGRINVEELTIASPIVRQTFSRIRGATHWENNRLTLAGLILARGLDVQSITSDLSRLGRKRIGLELDLDAFGGKIRGDISNEWRSNHSNWNIASSGADISLGQTAEAIGLADRVAGRLHAGKFTFRGDLRDPMRATASLWIELTAPAWRRREADLVMLGAALYNRQIDLQQLYVKQKKNQLTLSGEASFPEKSFDWFNPDFRANISASINNLDDFAVLFGATRGDFAGEIGVVGTMNARDRKVGGHVTASGTALTVFKTPVDSFTAALNLKTTQFEVEQFKLSRGQDFIEGQCKIDIGREREAAGSFAFSVAKASDYFKNSIFAGALTGRFRFDGQTAVSESAELNDKAITIPLSATVDFSDLPDVAATLTPAGRVFDLSGTSPGECIDRLQISSLARPGPSLVPITKADLRGDFANGLHSISLTTSAGEKEYRVLCSAVVNRPLPIGVAPEKRP